MKNPESTLARVLVVDAVPESAGLIELILRKFGGNEILRAQSVNEAIALIASQEPELILLDADLPGETAFDFCREICRHAETQAIPVILFSDRKDRRHMVRGFEAGAVDFMFKPIYPMELAARARSHLLLKRQKDALERKAIEHRELVQVMCHDVGGPVSACVNILEMTRDDPDELQDAIDHVIAALQKVNELTNLVRKMRSFEDGKMEWNLMSLELHEAVTDALSILGQRLEEKQIELRVDIDENLSVLAEPVSLVNSVIANLLTNAIKFSHSGSVIEIAAREEGASIVLSIEDHGIGMPASIRDNLFNINVPTNRRGTADEPGTGYGMPLIRKFMTGYKGQIDVVTKDVDEFPDTSGTRIELTFQRGVSHAVETVSTGAA